MSDENTDTANGDRKPEPGKVSIAKKQTNRRRVLRTILLTGGVLGAATSGFLPLIYSKKNRLRPPGALDEKDFQIGRASCRERV